MFTAKRRLRTVSWITVLAVCAAVLAPLAARTLGAGTSGASLWAELCSSLGIRSATDAGGGGLTERPAAPARLASDAACPYCLRSAPAGTPYDLGPYTAPVDLGDESPLRPLPAEPPAIGTR